jgi:hypothetical protein
MCDKDRSRAPHICCVTCVKFPTEWVNISRQMPFAVPMIWRQPRDRSSYCYFRFTNITGVTSKSKHTVKYPDFPSALRHIPHSQELSVSQPTENKTFGDDNSDSNEVHTDSKNGTIMTAIQHLKKAAPHLNPIINTMRS